MKIKGKVHKFGVNINTDDIIAAKYLDSQDPEFLGSKCMENIDPEFPGRVKKGDIIVAGSNFGCGSSREHAPWAIKGCGVSLVIAKSFARIFFRNAINVGLPIIELSATANFDNSGGSAVMSKTNVGGEESGPIDEISTGDLLEVDLSEGIVKDLSKNKQFKTKSFPVFLQEIIKKGGLLNWIRRR